jgi:hypothetical protein
MAFEVSSGCSGSSCLCEWQIEVSPGGRVSDVALKWTAFKMLARLQ